MIILYKKIKPNVHGSLVKTAQCHCLHSWIFRALSKMCTLLSHPKSNWMHPCPASTPTSLAFSRPFHSKQEAVDSFPWLFENTKSLIYKENPNFQSLIFFLYCSCGCECCKQERNQIPNCSELIQNGVAIAKRKS